MDGHAADYLQVEGMARGGLGGEDLDPHPAGAERPGPPARKASSR